MEDLYRKLGVTEHEMAEVRAADLESKTDAEIRIYFNRPESGILYFVARELIRRRSENEAREISRKQKARNMINKKVCDIINSDVGLAMSNEDREWLNGSADRCAMNEFCCEKTGEPFDVAMQEGEGAGRFHLAPSPDQIRPGGGYVRGNVQWVCWWVNRAKAQMSPETFDALLKRYAARQKE